MLLSGRGGAKEPPKILGKEVPERGTLGQPCESPFLSAVHHTEGCG